MADEEVDIEFDLEDKVSPKLSRMEKAAEKLDRAVGRLSEKFSRFTEMAGAVAGVFGGVESIRSAREYLEHVKRISNLTGVAADKVAGMSEALQVTGVETGEIEGMLTRMSKKSAMLTEENKAQAKLAQIYGINLTEGPEKSLLKASKLYEEHKISAGQIGRILGVQGRTLSNLIDSMEKGPAALKTMFDEAVDKNRFLAGDTMDIIQSFNESINRVKLTWTRMFAGVIVKIAPPLERLAAKVEDHIEGWSEKAGKFASFMVNHMEQLISMAKTYAKIMLVNSVLEKVSGRGIIGNVARVASMEGGVGGAVSGAFGFIKKLFTGAVALRPLLTILGRFFLIGSILMVAYYAVKYIMTSTSEGAKKIRQIFSNIMDHVRGIGRQFEKIFSEDSSVGRFFRWIGEGLVNALAKISGMFENVIYGLRVLMTMMTEHVGFGKAKDIIIAETYRESGLERLVREGWAPSLRGDVPSGPTGQITRMMRDKFAEFDKARSMYEAAGGPKMWSEAQLEAMRKRYSLPASSSKAPEATVIQDFRGSRFDITQQFAEGFDPDRVAVAFANDLASVGERKLQSGFAPLFTIR